MLVVGVAIVQRRAELLGPKDRLPGLGGIPGPDLAQGRGVGLNLSAADHVFPFDPWRSAAIELLAGRPVTAYRPVAENTVETKIRGLATTSGRVFEDSGIIASLSVADRGGPCGCCSNSAATERAYAE